ncbi:Do family serine endopeptidase [Coxiella endosymbiont of Amblyomma americanum]|uniref:Do family serine endopeptidase n=1 Tax=Coxiella endosymbiont of Amblyomma americanum TaxID=325775 RepID=UPI00057FE705|nr:Do family serine endopeptidase [Coxiella endosymbiont of Amblyomma americanum]AJC50346.1 endopeptidase [Coxiella endosymbiont of Amblyomma americanum]AUJ58692.1 endopeptidase [Coxiella-like endosymbiont of Amblyomma americanum]
MRKLLRVVSYSIITMAIMLFLPFSIQAHLTPNIDKRAVYNSLSPMLSKTTASVVNISVERFILQPVRSFKPDTQQSVIPEKVIGIGSGVIINAQKGYIVTNTHVIKDQKIILVTLKDGRRYRAQIIGKDKGCDLSVIQIRAKHLTEIPFSNSDRLKAGDFVVAIGSPFGLNQTVTYGIISALNRQDPRIDNFQNFIQTDAPINPGNSGGALIDLQGRLIGINTAIVTSSFGNIGIGFAIPSNMVKNISEQLIKYGTVKHSILGVTAQNITPELANALNLKHTIGALVTKIFCGSPAERAGLQVQDVIQSINQFAVHTSEQLHNILGLMRPGTTVHLVIVRDNHKIKKITTKTVDPKDIFHKHNIPFLGGMRLQQFSDLEPDGTFLNGVLITNINDDSNGALAGLQTGDIILNANGKMISTVKELIRITTQEPRQLLLKVYRGSRQWFLVISNDNNQ